MLPRVVRRGLSVPEERRQGLAGVDAAAVQQVALAVGEPPHALAPRCGAEPEIDVGEGGMEGLDGWGDAEAAGAPGKLRRHRLLALLDVAQDAARVPAVAGPRATPLIGDATAPVLSVAGLRLTDDSLLLKLERGGAAARFRLEPGEGFDFDDGVLAQHDVLAESRGFVTVLFAARGACRRGEPSAGRVSGDGDLLTAVDGLPRESRCARSRATFTAWTPPRWWTGTPTVRSGRRCAA